MKKEVIDNSRVFGNKVAAEKLLEEFAKKMPFMASKNGATLYKLFYGDRYVIHKGKTLSGSLFFFIKGLAYFIANKHDTAKDKSVHFFKMYTYINRHPELSFRVEIMQENRTNIDLLICEQIWLDTLYRDKKMLNNNIEPLKPNWITDEEYSEFHRQYELNG